MKERTAGSAIRHPWETARLAALKRILNSIEPEGNVRVLDIGCGDGFISAELFKDYQVECLAAVDSNFGSQEIAAATIEYPETEFHTRLEDVGDKPFDLILMLDVLEHIENDAEYLREIVERRLKPGGRVLATVPAFQFLFSGHDRFLRHFRRYDRAQLKEAALNAGLESLDTGYMFASLVPLRMASLSIEKLFPRLSPEPTGIGSWRRGPLITGLLELLLRADNSVIFSLKKRNLNVPGLTVWMLCQKPR